MAVVNGVVACLAACGPSCSSNAGDSERGVLDGGAVRGGDSEMGAGGRAGKQAGTDAGVPSGMGNGAAGAVGSEGSTGGTSNPGEGSTAAGGASVDSGWVADAGGGDGGRGGASVVAGGVGAGGSAGAGGPAGVGGGVPAQLPAPLVYYREPIGDPLDDVWGTITGEVYAVGYNGTIAHGPGDGTWKRESVSSSVEFYSVWGSSPTDVYVGMAGGQVAHATGAGSWTRRSVKGVSGAIYQVFGFARDDVYVATGRLFHGNLDRWQEVDAGPPANSVWGSSPGDLYTVATASLDKPNIYHSKGDGKWRAQATTGEYMGRVFGLDAGHVYAVGTHSVWFSAGDGTWRSVLTLPDELPVSLWGSNGLVYVGTQGGRVYVTNGVQWTSGQSIGTASIEGIWGSSTENVYLATSAGLYHGTPSGTPPPPRDGGSGADEGGTGEGHGDGGSGRGPFSTNPADFGGASRCSPSADFCEDFESGDFGSFHPIGSNLTVEQAHAVRGNYALHAHHDEPYGGGGLESSSPFPLPYDRFWLRLFVYFESLPGDAGPWMLVRAQNVVPALGYLWLGGYSDGAGSNVLMSSLDEPSVSLMDTGADAQIPLNQWICLEWYSDGLADEARVFWNNTERPSLHATRELRSTIDTGYYAAPEIDFVQIGWLSTTANTVDAWFDGIAIGNERIGCEN